MKLTHFDVFFFTYLANIKVFKGQQASLHPQLPGIPQVPNLQHNLGHQNLGLAQQSLQLALPQHQQLLSNPQLLGKPQLLGNPQHLLRNQQRPNQLPALAQPQIPSNRHQLIKEEIKSINHHGYIF